MTKINEAILRTLIYADLFDYPLTMEETWQFLIMSQSSKEEVKKIYQDLKLTKERGGFYFLKGREKIVELRKKRQKWSQKKLKIVQKTAAFLKLIPWVKMVGLTGSLAILNSDKEDDIDILIVSTKKRLWLTRLLVIFLVSLVGQRRRPQDANVKDKICLNMFLDEEHLEVPTAEQDLFSAHEVNQMKLLWDKDKMYTRFLQGNQWVKKYLPNGLNLTLKTKHSKLKKVFSLQFLIPVCHFAFCLLNFDFIENLVKIFQLWYMRKRRTTEVISDGIIRFHPRDARSWVMTDYQKRLEKLGISGYNG